MKGHLFVSGEPGVYESLPAFGRDRIAKAPVPNVEGFDVRTNGSRDLGIGTRLGNDDLVCAHSRDIADRYVHVKAHRYRGADKKSAMTRPSDRLKAARKAAGFATAADAARALGEHPQNVRDQEAGRRGINPDQAERYAKKYGVSPSEILFGDGHASSSGVSENDNVRMVGIVGEVRAGTFAEIPEEPASPMEFVPVNLPEYIRAHLFALMVVGRSMDRYYPDGSAVVVCPPQEAGVREGDHVVVRNWRGGMAETTLKEVVVEDGQVLLWPRSTDLAYQTPMRLIAERDSDGGPEIIGVVVGSFAARAARSGPLLKV
jgi:SOS-response transcriptional repressor LexA